MDCLDTPPPTYPGLAFAETLANMGHNSGLYAQLALLFIEQHSQDLEEIEAALEKGEQDTAANLIHNLRGTAGNIGAITLYHAMGDLEATVLATKSVTAVPTPVKQAMTELLTSLADLVAECSQPVGP